MLKELSIRNFRIFDTLDIEGLKRVNLIVGKNNTGKTTLLEALRLLAAKGNSTVVNHVLKNRGQFVPSWSESYDALYSVNSNVGEKALQINELEIVKQHNEDKPTNPEFRVTYRADFAAIFPFALNPSDTPDFPNDELIYIPFYSDNNILQKLWDKIALTPLEDEVVKMLKETIEPRLERIDVSGGVAKVKLENEEKPLPILALGDGVQRMLFIALALVNAKGKMLLIDELESGLHHSIQELLWKMIFQYAKSLEIQVFVTTHSKDTLRTFKYVSSEAANKNQGFLFRLQHNRKGKLEAIAYNQDRLEDALEMNLEIR
jgi:AAA15 family ATPase/GTPase